MFTKNELVFIGLVVDTILADMIDQPEEYDTIPTTVAKITELRDKIYMLLTRSGAPDSVEME